METNEHKVQMLDNILDITHKLYQEMCTTESSAKDNHFEIFRLITKLGTTLVNADRASFWKWDKDKHELWTTAAVGEERITIPENTGLVGKALTGKLAIVTNDPYNCPDFNADVDKKTGYVTKSILVMPISNCKGEFIGVFQAINSWTARDLTSARTAAGCRLPRLSAELHSKATRSSTTLSTIN